MLQDTHRKIASLITNHFGFTQIYLYYKAVYPDNHKHDKYPGNINVSLDEHHNIELNRDRIKKIIFYAKQCNKPHDHENAIDHYLNALHFLCDSPIPSLKIGFTRESQKTLGLLYDKVKIDPKWNSINESKLTESEIEYIIDEFLDQMPVVPSKNKEFVSTMKLVYQTGLKLAYYTFIQEKMYFKHKCQECKKIYYHESKNSIWCPECVNKKLKLL
jgi:hypothetical protein